MTTSLIIPLYTAIFFLIMILTVPRKEILRLGIYGMIFGAAIDIIVCSLGKLLAIFEYINFAPLGFWVIPFFAPLSWAVYFVIYFYFLPPEKSLMYFYVVMGILYSIFFTQFLQNVDIQVLNPKFFSMSVTKIINPLVIFSIWFPFSTWGFLKLSRYFEAKSEKVNKRGENLQIKRKFIN